MRWDGEQVSNRQGEERPGRVQVLLRSTEGRLDVFCTAAGKPPQANRLCRRKPCTVLHVAGGCPSCSSRHDGYGPLAPK